jgi:hypothetical protein
MHVLRDSARARILQPASLKSLLSYIMSAGSPVLMRRSSSNGRSGVMLLSGTESVGCSIRGEEGGGTGDNGRRLRGRSIC